MLSGHGDDGYLYKRNICANFSSNVYSDGLNQCLIEHLKTQIPSIASYPEPDAHSLASLIAKKIGLQTENVIITNGAVEAFYLIAQAWMKSSSTLFYPSFSEYEDATSLFQHTQQFLQWDNTLHQLSIHTDLCWLCNPNNPTGSLLSIDEIKSLVSANPHTLFIIDEAYIHLTPFSESATFLVHHNENICIVSSMTKQFSIPGLRLGYIASNSSVIERIRRFKQPWSVNSLAIAAGLYILKHNGICKPSITTLYDETQRFMHALSSTGQCIVHPSQTTFFLVKLLKGTAKDLKEYCIDTSGLLLRDASNFRGLDTSYIRIATQQMHYNDLLLEVIHEWMKKQH